MKTKILVVAFAVAVIASFSFITINKDTAPKKNTFKTEQQPVQPMSGFAMEDKNQF